MYLARLVVLLSLAGYVTTCVATGEEVCPAGPFETDLAKISSALAASAAAERISWDDSPGVIQGERVTEGFSSWGAGGFGAVPGEQGWQDYDAKRYLSVSGSIARGKVSEAARAFNLAKLGSRVVIRQQAADLVATTITARPSAEQARQIACLANQLFTTPSAEAAKPRNESHVSQPGKPIEVTIVGKRPANYCEAGQFTDAHQESFSPVTSVPGFIVGGPSCEERLDLQARLEQAAYEPVKELLARANGTWKLR